MMEDFALFALGAIVGFFLGAMVFVSLEPDHAPAGYDRKWDCSQKAMVQIPSWDEDVTKGRVCKVVDK